MNDMKRNKHDAVSQIISDTNAKTLLTALNMHTLICTDMQHRSMTLGTLTYYYCH